jgi:hypothetical protein
MITNNNNNNNNYDIYFIYEMNKLIEQLVNKQD